MRIRKNARRIVKGGLSNSSSFLICQLNRAPWDDPSFFTVGETTDSLPVSDSRETMEMELLFEYIEKTPPQSEREREKEVIEVPPVVSFLPAPVPDIPKKRGRPKKVTRRDRDRDRPANNNNNPYQFYYYSGFGPTWRKRRGGSRPNEDDYFVDMGEDNYDNVDVNNGNGNGVETPGCSSTTRESNTSGDEIDDDENKDKSSDNDNNNNNNSNSNGVVIESFESVREAERELDYIGDEEDEDEDGLHAGKRARKPIKARSLKSLM